MKEKKNCNNRIQIIDEIRGFAVLCMIFYHTVFILGEMFEINAAKAVFDFFMPVEPFFADIFIFICGLCCTLSHNNFKRGAIVFAAGMAFTAATCFVMPKLGYEDLQIYFGILHFLGIGIIICAFVLLLKEKINPYLGILICSIFYPLFGNIENGYLGYGKMIYLKLPEILYKTNIFMPLGFYSPDFFSGDYFPILPEIFVMLAGLFSGIILKAKGYSDFSKKEHIRFLGTIGRKAFIIYIVHMPVIYFAAYCIQYITNR